MGKTRVPGETDKFNDYITDTDTFLQADDPGNPGHKQWERLGLTSANAADWHSRNQAWALLHPKVVDPAQRTKVVNADVTTFKADFATFAGPILNKISGSENATSGDGIKFRVVLAGKRKKATHRTTAFTEQCFLSYVPLGGAEYKFLFRKSNDTKRPSIIPDASGIQVAVQLGGTPPASADDLKETYLITKATSVQKFGTQNIGKKLFAFVRWYYAQNDLLSGPWSDMYTINLS